MDEEENTDRKLQIAMLCQKLEKIKRYYNDDDTDNINQIISSNSPDTCRTFLTNLEKKGNPQSDPTLLSKLMDCYTRVFSSMPLGKHSQNLSYARMLVRFAELKAIQDVNDARDSFDIARSHCKDFAFVHIACAQFELLQGVGPLVPMKGTLNASTYQDILDNFMLPTLWEQFGDGPFLFQH